MGIRQQARADPFCRARGPQPGLAVITPLTDAGRHSRAVAMLQQRRFQRWKISRYILSITIKNANQPTARLP